MLDDVIFFCLFIGWFLSEILVTKIKFTYSSTLNNLRFKHIWLNSVFFTYY